VRLLIIWVTILVAISPSCSTQAVDYVNSMDGTISAATACGTTDLVRTFNVTDDFTVADVDLGFQADHTWRGDINLRLQSPTGTIVQLITTNIGGGGNLDNYNIILNDAASTLINTAPHNTPDGTTLSLTELIADLTAVKSVSVFDPANVGLYMTPGNEVLYTITVNNSAAATAAAEDINLSDTLPDNLTFVSATATGFTGGAFGSPALPAANTDCTGGNCVISFAGASLPEDSTGEIIVRAIIQ